MFHPLYSKLCLASWYFVVNICDSYVFPNKKLTLPIDAITADIVSNSFISKMLVFVSTTFTRFERNCDMRKNTLWQYSCMESLWHGALKKLKVRICKCTDDGHILNLRVVCWKIFVASVLLIKAFTILIKFWYNKSNFLAKF